LPFRSFYLFILLEAMNDSALEKIKQEPRETKLEIKVEVTRRE
jgi:hypothetical protein